MYFDRWDIVSAYYAFYSDFHSGQGSDEYKRLCHISTYFNPSPLWRGYQSLTQNGVAIYDRLVKKERK